MCVCVNTTLLIFMHLNRASALEYELISEFVKKEGQGPNIKKFGTKV